MGKTTRTTNKAQKVYVDAFIFFFKQLYTSGLTRDGTAEPVSRDQILKRERGQEKKYFPPSADPKQDWQPYPVDPYSAESVDHTYMHHSNFEVPI